MKSAVTPLSLGTDRLANLLLRYAIPSIIAMTSSSLYNIIDSIFIGHGVGALAISGLAITLPLMNIASAFGSMVGSERRPSYPSGWARETGRQPRTRWAMSSS